MTVMSADVSPVPRLLLSGCTFDEGGGKRYVDAVELCSGLYARGIGSQNLHGLGNWPCWLV